MTYIQDILDSQKELKIISRTKEEIICKAKRGPSKITRIPLKMSENLIFLIAAIMGDGHLKKHKMQITFECTNKVLIEKLKYIFKSTFKRNFNIYSVKARLGRLPSFHMCIDSKSIYNFFKVVFQIPSGKKSDIVKVPKYVQISNKSIKTAFLIGILVTEGGKRRRGFGLSTASNDLWGGIIMLFANLHIPIFTDKWIYKKYNKEYYGISFKKKEILKIANKCKNKNIGRILLNHDNLKI